MSESRKGRSSKIGMVPGTPVYLGETRTAPVTIEVLAYSETELFHKIFDDVAEAVACLRPDLVTWINMNGIHDTEKVTALTDHFQLHPLTREDILNSNHRPKAEYFDHYIHFTLKMLNFDTRNLGIQSEQVSFILTQNAVLSFQENPGDVFQAIRERVESSKGKIRSKKSDFLAYSLIDIIVDHYFIIIENLEKTMFELENELMRQADDKRTLERILKIKKDLLFLRNSIIPVREAVNAMQNADSKLIEPSTRQFLRDVHDHAVHAGESIETYREMVNSLMEIHLTSLSNKLNNVMKTLTVISTVFIPLTFIAGLYGMNVSGIPYSENADSFYWITGIMVAIPDFMVFVLNRKKWL